MGGGRVWHVAGLQIMRHHFRPIVFIAIFICLGIALILAFWLNDPQGEENSDCMHADKFSNAGPAGMSVSGHITVCSPPAASIATYVYVHPTGLLPTPNNLVFRYSQSATIEAPRISWTDSQHVLVEAIHVESISKKKQQLGSVSITYKIDAGLKKINF